MSRCRNGILELHIKTLRGKYGRSSVLTHDPMRYLSMPKSSTVMDPIDHRNVYVAPSRLGSGAGEGIFAKRDIAKGAIVVTYAGTLVSKYTDLKDHCNSVRVLFDYVLVLLQWIYGILSRSLIP